MGRVDRLVAVREIGVRDEVQKIVRAGAADDAVGIKPERSPDRLAQLGGGDRLDNPRRCSPAAR